MAKTDDDGTELVVINETEGSIVTDPEPQAEQPAEPTAEPAEPPADESFRAETPEPSPGVDPARPAVRPERPTILIGEWNGLPNYLCSHCDAASLVQGEIEWHIYRMHPEPPQEA